MQCLWRLYAFLGPQTSAREGDMRVSRCEGRQHEDAEDSHEGRVSVVRGSVHRVASMRRTADGARI